MRKNALYFFIMFVSLGTIASAQTDSAELSNDKFRELTESVKEVQIVEKLLQQKIENLTSLLSVTNEQVQQNTANIRTTAEELGVKIDTTSTQLSEQQSALQRNVRSKTGWGIGIGVLLLALAGAIYFVLRRKIQGNGDVIEQIRSSQQRLQEELVKLDSQLVELLEKQMTMAAAPATSNAAPDHSLTLKVADEIVRIEANLFHMDSSIKGYKQLQKSVQRIRDNFMSKDYEIVEMLGKPYNEGMKVSANFVPDETLKEGEQVITRIIKPQVNYNGVMVQAAQIEVSQNI